LSSFSPARVSKCIGSLDLSEADSFSLRERTFHKRIPHFQLSRIHLLYEIFLQPKTESYFSQPTIRNRCEFLERISKWSSKRSTFGLIHSLNNNLKLIIFTLKASSRVETVIMIYTIILYYQALILHEKNSLIEFWE